MGQNILRALKHDLFKHRKAPSFLPRVFGVGVDTIRGVRLAMPCLPAEAWVGGSAAREGVQVARVTIPTAENPARSECITFTQKTKRQLGSGRHVAPLALRITQHTHKKKRYRGPGPHQRRQSATML